MYLRGMPYLTSRLFLSAAVLLANCQCGPISPATKTVLTDVATVAGNPADCTFVSELDSDPSAAIICKVIQGVVTVALNTAASMKKLPPSKSYHSITVPGDTHPSVYLRDDLWSADVEAKIVAGIKAKRVAP